MMATWGKGMLAVDDGSPGSGSVARFSSGCGRPGSSNRMSSVSWGLAAWASEAAGCRRASESAGCPLDFLFSLFDRMPAGGAFSNRFASRRETAGSRGGAWLFRVWQPSIRSGMNKYTSIPAVWSIFFKRMQYGGIIGCGSGCRGPGHRGGGGWEWPRLCR